MRQRRCIVPGREPLLAAVIMVSSIFLLMSGTVNGQTTTSNLQQQQQVDKTTLCSKLSSMFGGTVGIVNAAQSQMQFKDAEKTEKAHLDKEGKDEKVEDIEVDDEGLPNKTSLDVSDVAYSSTGGKSHMSLLLEQKAHALELQHQGKGCDDCENDDKGNMLPSSLVHAICMQKRKQETNLHQSASKQGNGLTLSDRGAIINDSAPLFATKMLWGNETSQAAVMLTVIVSILWREFMYLMGRESSFKMNPIVLTE
jgi:hypothetical protein